MSLITYEGEAGDDYHRRRHEEILGNDRLIEAWSRYAAEVYFPDLAAETKILEVGAGTGVNIAFVAKHHPVTAIEPSPMALEHCRSVGIVEAYGTLEELPEGKTFDRILLRHVLEHVQEPRQMLLAIRKRLRSGGSLVVVLPAESPSAEVDPNDFNFHLYCWNRPAISNLLRDCDFQVTDARLHFFNGRRLFLPAFEKFGINAYSAAMQSLGKLRRSGEILVRASLPPVSAA